VNVLLTGATGLIGRATAAALSEAHHVIAMSRQGRGDVQGDLLDAPSLIAAVAGAVVVVHAAGKVGATGRRETFFAVNVAGTQRLVQAAHDAGVRRLIYVSTLRVLGLRPEHGADEDAPYVETGDAYGDSKVAAERWLREQNDLDVVIVRPGYVFGRGDRHFLPALCEALTDRKLRLVGDGDNRIDPMFAPDVGRLIAVSLALPAGTVLNLLPSDPVTARELTDAICSLTSLPRPRSTSPRTAELALENWSQGASSGARYDIMALDRRLDRSRLERMLGPAPTTALPAALRATLTTDG